MKRLHLHTPLLIGLLWQLLTCGGVVAVTTTPDTHLQAQGEWVVQERGVAHVAEPIVGERREQDVKRAELQQQLAQLFGEQFARIDQLSTIYYETHGLKKDKEAIYKRVCDEIAHWSNQKKNARELEQIVDRYKEGVMTRLREEMTSLSELDYQILCYSYAGFSTKATSIFLGTTVGTIDTRRYRLRIKIIEQNPR